MDRELHRLINDDGHQRNSGHKKRCSCIPFIVVVVCAVLIMTFLVLLNPVSSVSINNTLPPSDLSIAPLVIMSANVSAWFPLPILLTYSWTLPDGTHSNDPTPSWNTSGILASSYNDFPVFQLTVKGIIPLPLFGANATSPFNFFLAPRTLLDTGLASNCTGLPPGVLHLSPPVINVSVGSILLVPKNCGTARIVTAILSRSNTFVKVNTSGVALNDVFQELAVSGSLASGPAPHQKNTLHANPFIKWLLEPGSISVSASSSAKFSITPTLSFSPHLTYEFLVIGWKNRRVSLGLAGDLQVGIALDAVISEKASLSASVPLGLPIEGDVIFLPIGPPPGIPVVPSLKSDASVEFSFEAADTISTAAQLTISASVTVGYNLETGFFADHSFSTSEFVSPPASLKSCGWSVEIKINTGLELSLFGYYPSLSLGPSLGVKLTATSAPEKDMTAKQYRMTSLTAQQKQYVSSFVPYTSLNSKNNWLDVPASSLLKVAESPSECEHCDNVPPGQNPGFMRAELLGLLAPLDLELAVLPWLTQSWQPGETESSPWWSGCYTLGSTSSCKACCGSPVKETFAGQIQSIYHGQDVMVNYWAQLELCSVFSWLDPTPGRYCLMITPQDTPNVTPGGCYVVFVMSTCVTPLKFIFLPASIDAEGGDSNGDWYCTCDCDGPMTITLSGNGADFIMDSPFVTSTFKKITHQPPYLIPHSSELCY